jgi:hypothetical protein
MPNTVLLSGSPNYMQEKQAAAAILPGHLLQLSTATNTVAVHAVANGNAMPAWARESLTPDRGSAATNPIDVPYATGETVRWFMTKPGDMVYAIVAAAAPAIVIGDDLVSAGDGTVKKNVPGSITTNVACIIGKAVEAVNNSAGTAAVRIRVISI